MKRIIFATILLIPLIYSCENQQVTPQGLVGDNEPNELLASTPWHGLFLDVFTQTSPQCYLVDSSDVYELSVNSASVLYDQPEFFDLCDGGNVGLIDHVLHANDFDVLLNEQGKYPEGDTVRIRANAWSNDSMVYRVFLVSVDSASGQRVNLLDFMISDEGRGIVEIDTFTILPQIQ